MWTKKHERDHQECSNLLPRCCLVLTTKHHWLLKMRVRAKEQWLVTLKGSGAWHCATVVWNGQQLNLPLTLSFPLATSRMETGPQFCERTKKKKPNNFFLRSRVCLFLLLSLPYIYHLPHSFLISKKIFPFLSLIHIALSSLSSHLYLPHTYPQLAFQVTSTSHFCSFSLFLASDLTNPVAISAHLISI